MNLLHNFLMDEDRLYRKWHVYPRSSFYHWLGFLSIVVLAATGIFSNINDYALELIEESSATIVSAATGPVAAYSFNASSGTTLTDDSGNGNTGVLTNGPTWVAGKNGNAISFDGTNDYVSIPNSS